MKKQSKEDALIYFLVTLLFGYLGIHKFIDKKPKMGILYLFTVGLFGIGWIVDFISAFAAYRKIKNLTIEKTVNKISITSEEKWQTITYNAGSDFNTFLQKELLRIDAMATDGFCFEHYCAELLMKNGFSKAEVTQGSGDFGVDIIAEKDNISYAIQCKCYSSPVGNKAVQEAYSGKEFYKCMVAAVLTNNTFTKAAEETAKQTRVLLWDRTYLQKLLSVVYKQNNVSKSPTISKIESR